MRNFCFVVLPLRMFDFIDVKICCNFMHNHYSFRPVSLTVASRLSWSAVDGEYSFMNFNFENHISEFATHTENAANIDLNMWWIDLKYYFLISVCLWKRKPHFQKIFHKNYIASIWKLELTLFFIDISRIIMFKLS